MRNAGPGEKDSPCVTHEKGEKKKGAASGEPDGEEEEEGGGRGWVWRRWGRRVWQRRQMIAGEHRNYKALGRKRQKVVAAARDADDVIHEA